MFSLEYALLEILLCFKLYSCNQLVLFLIQARCLNSLMKPVLMLKSYIICSIHNLKSKNLKMLNSLNSKKGVFLLKILSLSITFLIINNLWQDQNYLKPNKIKRPPPSLTSKKNFYQIISVYPSLQEPPMPSSDLPASARPHFLIYFSGYMLQKKVVFSSTAKTFQS